MRKNIILTWAAVLGLWPLSVAAQQKSDADHFNDVVLPILTEHCLSCHSHEAGKAKGGLVLDSRTGWMTGGDSGPAVIPGNVKESILIQAVRYSDDYEMPPDGALAAEQVAALEQWVQKGAFDPRTGRAVVNETIDIEAGRQFWSFQPIQMPTVPAKQGAGWARNDVDRFVWRAMRAQGLRPAPDADRTTLIRRAFFDLVGLPPTPQQIDAFIADRSPGAWQRLVDGLLASPAFGERWGRHWLDVARYSDSSGGGRALLFRDAWRYRDYVVDAFNKDKPFDQFIKEQLAGDLLPFETDAQRAEQLVASGFLVMGAHNYDAQNNDQLRMDIVDEQITTVGRSMLGMTLGCARCHDHKFDPVPTADYYALAGIFRSTKTAVFDHVSRWHTAAMPMAPSQSAFFDELRVKREQTKKTLGETKKRCDDLNAHLSGLEHQKGRDGASDVELTETLELTRSELTACEAKQRALKPQLESLDKQWAQRPTAMATSDEPLPVDAHLLIRGEINHPGEPVPRGFVQVATTPGHAKAITEGSGRLQMADWIASADNPLTTRVLVNRVWYWLMAQGLVRTVDNFGTSGDRPSHPLLLDHLAARFAQQGWSVKQLIRTIVLSRTYGLSSRAGRQARVRDPENRWLTHAHRRRLDAEAIRDSMLYISGQLNDRRGGPSIPPGTESEIGYRFTHKRRSLYTPIFRYNLLEFLETFDFADPSLVGGKRRRTTTAPQALYLLNNRFVLEQAEFASRRTLAVWGGISDAARVREAYRIVLGRLPSIAEARSVQAYLRQQPRGHDAAETQAWAGVFHSLFASLDFRFIS